MTNNYGYVYKITCLVNGKVYVGSKRSNVFIEDYWSSSCNEEYWNDLKNFGKENFKREVLYWAKNKLDLEETEKKYILSENALASKGGYNLCITWKRVDWTEKQRKKHSEKKKIVMQSEQYKLHMSEALKKSEKVKRCKNSEEYKKKLSEARKKWYADPKNYKKQIMSLEDTKEKRNEAQRNSKKARKHILELNQKLKNMKWFNNGIINKRALTCPKGFVEGLLSSTRKKISKARKNSKISYELVCQYCGKKFVAKQKFAKYCCGTCKTYAYRKPKNKVKFWLRN